MTEQHEGFMLYMNYQCSTEHEYISV